MNAFAEELKAEAADVEAFDWIAAGVFSGLEHLTLDELKAERQRLRKAIELRESGRFDHLSDDELYEMAGQARATT